MPRTFRLLVGKHLAYVGGAPKTLVVGDTLEVEDKNVDHFIESFGDKFEDVELAKARRRAERQLEKDRHSREEEAEKSDSNPETEKTDKTEKSEKSNK